MLTKPIEKKVIDHLKIKTNTNDWVFILPGIKAKESTVYRLKSSFYSKDLALKIYTINNPASQARSKLQYSAIKKFYLANQDVGRKYRTPQPFGCFSKDGFYLMEWVTGENLRDTLWRNCLFKGQLQKNIREAYKWLSHYHSQANLDVMTVDTMNYSKSLEVSMGRPDSQGFCNNNLVFKSGFEAFNVFKNNFTDYETKHADIHGDLNLGNIILDSNHITGIDIGAARHAPIENDLAEMLNYICVNYFLMLPRSSIKEDMSKWEIFNVALDAYNYPNERKAREYFMFVFFYQSLQRWIAIEYTHKKNKNHTSAFVLLGKWRMHNCSVIVDGLTQVIKDRYLK